MTFTDTDDWEQLQEETMEAIRDPRPGDGFQEMFSVWCYVIRVEDSRIWTLGLHPPGKLPDDGVLKILGRSDFRKMMTYETDRDSPVMMLHERGADVEGWARVAIEKELTTLHYEEES